MSHPLLPLYREADAAIALQAKRNSAHLKQHPSCTKGCDACCHLLVSITLAEALYIVAACTAYPKRREGLRRVIRECERQRNLLSQDHIDHTTWFDLHEPCPFLVDRKCSIYNERPVSCRAYVSYDDPKLCSINGARIRHTDVTPFTQWFDTTASKQMPELPNITGPLQAMMLLAVDLFVSHDKEKWEQVMMRHGGNAGGVFAKWMHVRRDRPEYPQLYENFLQDAEIDGDLSIAERIKPYPAEFYASLTPDEVAASP